MKRCNKFVENMVSVILYFSFNAPLVLNQSYYKNNYNLSDNYLENIFFIDIIFIYFTAHIYLC